MTRRKMLILASSAVALAVIPGWASIGPARSEEAKVFADDRILGEADAPITIIEYSSLTCPHCASFHAGALPEIKKTWIAGGKARLIYRHFPLDGLALRAAAVANCLEGEDYFAFLDLLFETQERWSRSRDPLKALGQYARLAGMKQERFDACVNDEAEMNRILLRRQDGSERYGIASTPTLIVNGRKIDGVRGFGELDAMFRKIVPPA